MKDLISRLAGSAGESRIRKKISDGRSDSWRTFERNHAGMACFIWNVARDHRGSVVARLLRFVAESAWQLWPGRGIHPCKREGFWAWRSARYHGRNRCCAQKISDRQQSPRCDRLELWRGYYDLGGGAEK